MKIFNFFIYLLLGILISMTILTFVMMIYCYSNEYKNSKTQIMENTEKKEDLMFDILVKNHVPTQSLSMDQIRDIYNAMHEYSDHTLKTCLYNNELKAKISDEKQNKIYNIIALDLEEGTAILENGIQRFRICLDKLVFINSEGQDINETVFDLTGNWTKKFK